MSLDHYVLLGRSGLRVSPLSLGTMTFGTETGWGADRATAKALFDLYVDAGGNAIDTADGYTGGTSEAWLGEFVRERQLRDRVVLATKYTYNAEPGNPNAGGNQRKNLMRALEGSLKRLQTDYIDLYYLHTWDRLTPAEEAMRTLDDAVRAGKIRYVGLSDVPAWYAARAQTLAQWRGYEPVAALQLEYSLVERSIEAEFTDLAVELGMGIVPWSPLGQGVLSGKYQPGRDGADASRLRTLTATPGSVFDKLGERNFGIVAALEAVAAELGKPMAQVALNWLAQRKGVSSVILGATRLEQLQQSLAALDFALPPELATRLDAASTPAVAFPHNMFTDSHQAAIHGGVDVRSAAATHAPVTRIPAAPA